MHTVTRRIAPFLSLAACLFAAVFVSAPARALTEEQQDQAIASLQATVASQQSTINALVAKLQYVTASGHDLTLTGNLHVVSGAGTTDAVPNGLGNVIIGYNETRTGSSNTRTGSHNLILGRQNNYSSYGGIVAGQESTVTGAFSSALGGRSNTVSGHNAVVVGGYRNAASGSYAVVGGGQSLTASAAYAFAPFDATIAGLQTSLTAATRITGLFSLTNGVGSNTELTLTGVNLHVVNGLGATNGEPTAPYDADHPVVNGLGNVIIGYNVTRAHVPDNPGSDIRTGSHMLIVGDENNYSAYGGLVAGSYNTTSAPFASISGGSQNTASEDFSSISGGYVNTASNYYASVGGGYRNNASGYSACVSGGGGNTASGGVSSVSGGVLNTASGNNSSVSGGYFLLESSTSGWAAGGVYTTSSPGPGVFHAP